MKKINSCFKSGFTLIELLIVIGLIALLAAAAIVALNPAGRLLAGRNAQRWQDVTAVADAMSLYYADGHTTIAPTVAAQSICKAAKTLNCDIDLTDLVTQGLLGAIPTDPAPGAGVHAEETGYEISKTVAGVVKVKAPEAEGAATIEVYR